MDQLTTSSFSNLILYEGINEIPRMSVTLEDNKQYGYPQGCIEVDINGYKGFIDKVSGQTINIKLLDPKVAQKFESKYLGNSLRNAIQSLNLKSDIVGQFPNINQEFHMVKERPWKAFIRLSRYLPEDYFMACLGDKIKIFKKPNPGEYKEIYISEFITESDYTGYIDNLSNKLDSDSELGNSYYGGLLNIPLSRMMMSDIVKSSGTDIINNYVKHYYNRDSYFPENMIFRSTSAAYEIGDGVRIKDTDFMIISRTFSLNNSSAGGAAYRCIKVS